jgi:hypothetical protein
MKTEEELIWESYTNEAINNITWFHGSYKKHDTLEYGDGIDGIGIYLTKIKDRAKQYAQTNKQGGYSDTFYIHTVKVNININEIWNNDYTYNLSEFTDEKWLKDLIKQHGEKAKFMDGRNAKIYLGFDNNDIKKLGYKAIYSNPDLIILDKNSIESIT